MSLSRTQAWAPSARIGPFGVGAQQRAEFAEVLGAEGAQRAHDEGRCGRLLHEQLKA
jgi:hypothetical protein